MDLIKELMYKLAEKEFTIDGNYYYVHTEARTLCCGAYAGSTVYSIYLDNEAPDAEVIEIDDEDEEIIMAYKHYISFHVLDNGYATKHNHITNQDEHMPLETLIAMEIQPLLMMIEMAEGAE